MNKEIILQEIDSMIRTLDFIQEQQSYIKLKLSSLLDHLVKYNLLDWAEELQQEILKRETAVQLLKRDLIQYSNQVKNNKPVQDIIDATMATSYRKYKQQVGYIESKFFGWKKMVNEQFDDALN